MMSRTARLGLATAAGIAMIGAGASTASAADPTPPAPVPAGDLSAATTAASNGEAMNLAARVAARQASANPTAGATASTQSVRAGAARTLIPGTTTAVNMLSREFVEHGTGPVAHLGYVANSARVGDQVVSIWTVKRGSGWKAVNAAAGGLEADLARKAGGAPIFREPQINAFYALKGDRVVPLNAAARDSVGEGMSLASYQKLVHGRYAAMLPGSDYDKQGTAGGFGQPGAAAPMSTATPASAATGHDGWILAGGIGVVTAAAAAGVLARRRSTSS